MVLSIKTIKFSNLTAQRELSILRNVVPDGIISGMAPHITQSLPVSTWTVNLSPGWFIVDGTVVEEDASVTDKWTIDPAIVSTLQASGDVHIILYVEYRYDEVNSSNVPEFRYLHGLYTDNISLDSRGDINYDPDYNQHPLNDPKPPAVKLADIYIPAAATEMSDASVTLVRPDLLKTRKEILDLFNTHLTFSYEEVSLTMAATTLDIDVSGSKLFGITPIGSITEKDFNSSVSITNSQLSVTYADAAKGFIIYSRFPNGIWETPSSLDIEYAVIELQDFIANSSNQKKIHGNSQEWIGDEFFGYRPDLGNIFVIGYCRFHDEIGNPQKDYAKLELVDGAILTATNTVGQDVIYSRAGRVSQYVQTVSSSVHGTQVSPDGFGDIDLLNVITNLDRLSNIGLDVAYDSTSLGNDPGDGRVIHVDSDPIKINNDWFFPTPFKLPFPVSHVANSGELTCGAGLGIENYLPVGSRVRVPLDQGSIHWIDSVSSRYPTEDVLFVVTATGTDTVSVSISGLLSDSIFLDEIDFTDADAFYSNIVANNIGQPAYPDQNPWHSSISISLRKDMGANEAGIQEESRRAYGFGSAIDVYSHTLDEGDIAPDNQLRSTSGNDHGEIAKTNTSAISLRDYVSFGSPGFDPFLTKDHKITIVAVTNGGDVNGPAFRRIRIEDAQSTITDQDWFDIFGDSLTHSGYTGNGNGQINLTDRYLYATLKIYDESTNEIVDLPANKKVYYLYRAPSSTGSGAQIHLMDIAGPESEKVQWDDVSNDFFPNNGPLSTLYAVMTVWRTIASIGHESRFQNAYVEKWLNTSNIKPWIDRGQATNWPNHRKTVQIFSDFNPTTPETDAVSGDRDYASWNTLAQSIDIVSDYKDVSLTDGASYCSINLNVRNHLLFNGYSQSEDVPYFIGLNGSFPYTNIKSGFINSVIERTDHSDYQSGSGGHSVNSPGSGNAVGNPFVYKDRYYSSLNLGGSIVYDTRSHSSTLETVLKTPTQLKIDPLYRQVLIDMPVDEDSVGISSSYSVKRNELYTPDTNVAGAGSESGEVLDQYRFIDDFAEVPEQVLSGTWTGLTGDVTVSGVGGDADSVLSPDDIVKFQGDSTEYKVLLVNNDNSITLYSALTQDITSVLCTRQAVTRDVFLPLGRNWLPTLGVYDRKPYPDRSLDASRSGWKYGTTLEIGNTDPGNDSISEDLNIVTEKTGPSNHSRSSTVRFLSMESTVTDALLTQIGAPNTYKDFGFNHNSGYTAAQIVASLDYDYVRSVNNLLRQRDRFWASKLEFQTSASWHKTDGGGFTPYDTERGLEANYNRPLTGLATRAVVDSEGVKARYLRIDDLGDRDWPDTKAPPAIYADRILSLSSHSLDKDDYNYVEPEYSRSGLSLSSTFIKNINNNVPIQTKRLEVTKITTWNGNEPQGGLDYGGGEENFVYIDSGVIFRSNSPSTAHPNTAAEKPPVYLNYIETGDPQSNFGETDGPSSKGSVYMHEGRSWNQDYLRVHRGIDTDTLHANVGCGPLFPYDHIIVSIEIDTEAIANGADHAKAGELPVKYEIVGSVYNRVRVVRGGTHRMDLNVTSDGSGTRPYPTTDITGALNLTHDLSRYNALGVDTLTGGTIKNSGPGDGIAVFECQHNDVFPYISGRTPGSARTDYLRAGSVQVQMANPGWFSNVTYDSSNNRYLGNGDLWGTDHSPFTYWLPPQIYLGDKDPIVKSANEDALTGGSHNQLITPGDASWSWTDSTYTKQLKTQAQHDMGAEPYYGFRRDGRRFTLVLTSLNIQPQEVLGAYDKDVIGTFNQHRHSNNGFCGINFSSSSTVILDGNATTAHAGYQHFSTQAAKKQLMYITIYSGKNWDNTPEESGLTGFELSVPPDRQKKVDFLESEGQPSQPESSENSDDLNWETVSDKWYSS